MKWFCEFARCPMAVARPDVKDERSHLCPGHAYALVIVLERRNPEWFKDWCPQNWPADKKTEMIDTFLNSCRLIAEAHRDGLLAWRRRNPHVDRQK